MKTVEASIPVDHVGLGATVCVPASALGVVLFAHGSGSSRHSPRNRSVADVLNHAGLATVLFDLLSDREAADRANVFDVALLAERLRAATAFVRAEEMTAGLPVAYFGASTGAAAAILAAADDGEVRAVVSRGGRPDLAGDALARLRAPTLLIVGERDEAVLAMTRRVMQTMSCEKRLAIVPGATHLFEEPGALAAVADLAAGWIIGHLQTGGGDAAA